MSQAKFIPVAAEPDPEDQYDIESKNADIKQTNSRNVGVPLLKAGLTGLAVKIALVRQGHQEMISSKCLLGIAALITEQENALN